VALFARIAVALYTLSTFRLLYQRPIVLLYP